MTLATHLKQRRGRVTELARALEVSISTVSMWASGHRRVPAERCRLISQLTGVSNATLRPDIFRKGKK